MTSELLSGLVIVVIAIAIVLVHGNWHRIKRKILGRSNSSPEAEQRMPREPESPVTENDARFLTEEEMSQTELERLQKLIDDRKKIARDTDISYHVWGLYKSLFRRSDPRLLNGYFQDGEWYEVKILRTSTQNGLTRFEFELKGGNYAFVDDEESQGWCEHVKFFNLFLYDESGRCLIQIPMKLRVDSTGRHYSISSEGPRAFLPNGWVSDFVNVRLKHNSIRNQEIRTQKHKDRLREIEDLKARFGISD